MNKRDYRETSRVIVSDLDVMFEYDPDAIDVLLYRAKLDTTEVATSLVQDVVGSLESDERLIEYEDPVLTRAIFLPFEFQAIAAMDQGDMAADFETPLVMLIQGNEIPKASVIQYDEYIGPKDDDVRRVTLYVMHSDTVGQSPAIAYRYYLIPFFDEEGVFKPPVISGRVVSEEDGETVPMAGIAISFSDGGGTVVTDEDGTYRYRVPMTGWSGTATPVQPMYSFTPARRTYSSVLSDMTDQDFHGVVIDGN